jgi:tRNA threonylcarbamoyl adenosine modification protein YeaZ
LILLLDTTSPEVAVGISDDRAILAEQRWTADRTLAETFADRINAFLSAQRVTLQNIKRIIVHAGPGGFTTLRIGVTTANALGYALQVPVVGVVGPVASLIDLLRRGEEMPTTTEVPVVPVYNRPPHITL